MIIIFSARLKTQNDTQFISFFSVWNRVSTRLASKWEQLLPLKYADILKYKKVLRYKKKKKNCKFLEIITGGFLPLDFMQFDQHWLGIVPAS